MLKTIISLLPPGGHRALQVFSKYFTWCKFPLFLPVKLQLLQRPGVDPRVAAVPGLALLAAGECCHPRIDPSVTDPQQLFAAHWDPVSILNESLQRCTQPSFYSDAQSRSHPEKIVYKMLNVQMKCLAWRRAKTEANQSEKQKKATCQRF